MEWTPVSGAVLSADLCSLYGCSQCPGHVKIRNIPTALLRETGETPKDPDAIVLCHHECHRVDPEELEAEDREAGNQATTLTCPRCGYVMMLPGFIAVDSYICTACGETVEPKVQ